MCLKVKQQGSALIIALFVIVVFMLLASVLVRVLSSGASAVAYEVIGTRAFTSAQTGANWGMMLLFPHNQPANTCAAVNAVTEPDLSAVAGLAGCRFTVSCNDLLDNGTRYYTLESQGQCSAGEVTTTRTIRVDARSID